MADFPKFNDLFALARYEVLSRNKQLTVDAVDRAGSDANAIVAVGALVGDEVAGHASNVFLGAFLGTAVGPQLDYVVYDRYGMTRKPASPAYGMVEFSTPTATTTPFVIPADTPIKTSDGKLYKVIADTDFPINSTGPIQAPVVSVLSGSGQRVRKNTLTNLTVVLAGAPVGVTVNNPMATAGDDDEELDDDLRARAQSARDGSGSTAAAVQLRARAVAGVQSATLFEFMDANGMPDRACTLVITDQYTDELANLSDAVPAYEAQSMSFARMVLAQLSDTRPCGIPIYVYVARTRLLQVTLKLTYNAVATADTPIAARAAIVTYTNNLRPGAVWSPATANRALLGIPGLTVMGNEVTFPTGPVVPGQLEVLRTTLTLVALGAYAS